MAGDPIDPLLVMIQRHEAANAAYDKLEADGVDADQAFEKCSETARAIVDRSPPATTAAGAIAALDMVLAEGDWSPPGQYAHKDFLRHLITAARDYIKRTATD